MAFFLVAFLLAFFLAFLRVAFFLAFLRVAFFLVAFLRVAFFLAFFLVAFFLAFFLVDFFLVAFLRVVRFAAFRLAFFLAMGVSSPRGGLGMGKCALTGAQKSHDISGFIGAPKRLLSRNRNLLPSPGAHKRPSATTQQPPEGNQTGPHLISWEAAEGPALRYPWPHNATTQTT